VEDNLSTGKGSRNWLVWNENKSERKKNEKKKKKKRKRNEEEEGQQTFFSL
jgi:hypothetical protein